MKKSSPSINNEEETMEINIPGQVERKRDSALKKSTFFEHEGKTFVVSV